MACNQQSTSPCQAAKIDIELEVSRKDLLIEKCGVFGCIANGEWDTNLGVANIICLGLLGLQHRGQEAAGIVTGSGKPGDNFSHHRSNGLVSEIYNDSNISKLKGNLGIGHTRYSTLGGADIQLDQPFIVHTSYGLISVAHNGELVNAGKLRQTLLDRGVGLSTGSDSELITQCLSMMPPEKFLDPVYLRNNYMLNRSFSGVEQPIFDEDIKATLSSLAAKPAGSRKTSTVLKLQEKQLLSRLLHFMSLTPLSYSLAIMYEDCLYAIRDPFGNRPLCIGMLTSRPEGETVNGQGLNIDGWVISSESCSFPSVSAKLYRDIEPGEIVKFENNKLPRTLAFVPRDGGAKLPAMCIFEYVYFARSDSVMEGQMVYSVRMTCGRQLAIEAPIDLPAETLRSQFIVAPVPESSIPAALGYAAESGIPYAEVFSRNRYVGRTFIQPTTRLRRNAVSKKFGPLSTNFQGKSIILIDDSIVRGTTIGQLIKILKDHGAKDVHIRIASPPLHHPCYMGINIPTREELIANHLNQQQLAEKLGASSLVHLSIKGLEQSVQEQIRERQHAAGVDKPIGHCTACLTGQYPAALDF
ncbi:Amidophosphoribosyltransferase [Halotydeus destructor]|nr:Amidophosphoribosyltransferase [Halotydeus destructor]